MTTTASAIASQYLKLVDRDFFIQQEVKSQISVQMALQKQIIAGKIADALQQAIDECLVSNPIESHKSFQKAIKSLVDEKISNRLDDIKAEMRDLNCYDKLYDKVATGLIKEMNRRMKLITNLKG